MMFERSDVRRSNGWAERGREIIAAERAGEPSPLLPHSHGPFRVYSTIGGFEFHMSADTGQLNEFRHGLAVQCVACGQHLPEDSPVARRQVEAYLVHSPAARAARSLGRHLGIQGTRRPALGAERKADV